MTPAPPPPVLVTLTPTAIRIRDLTVGGSALDAVRRAATDGLDPESAVRCVMEIGGLTALMWSERPHDAAADSELDPDMAAQRLAVLLAVVSGLGLPGQRQASASREDDVE